MDPQEVCLATFLNIVDIYAHIDVNGKNWRTLVTTDNVKPDSQLQFHGQAQHSLQSSRTTSEFAIKWSQAEHCTLPTVPRL